VAVLVCETYKTYTLYVYSTSVFIKRGGFLSYTTGTAALSGRSTCGQHAEARTLSAICLKFATKHLLNLLWPKLGPILGSF